MDSFVFFFSSSFAYLLPKLQALMNKYRVSPAPDSLSDSLPETRSFPETHLVFEFTKRFRFYNKPLVCVCILRRADAALYKSVLKHLLNFEVDEDG